MAVDKVAVVTGGSRGIGAAIARQLASDGFVVVINHQGTGDAAVKLVDKIVSEGGSATAIRADVTDQAQLDMLFDGAMQLRGAIHTLVCSAGINSTGPFCELSEQAYDRLFAITKATYFTMSHGFARISDGGRIVALSTGLTRGWAPNAAAYAGSKAAIEQFVRSLSKEAGLRNVTVNAVLPGVVETDMTRDYGEAKLEAARKQTSFGRLGTPQDIANVVSFLAGEKAGWVTGQLIVANGGSTP